MKYIQTQLNPPAVKDLEERKVKLFSDGDPGGERIFVGVDKNTNKMYLMNHSYLFMPYPSWGTELDYAEETNVDRFRGQTPNETVLTVHPETIEGLKGIGHINDEGGLTEKFYDDMTAAIGDEEEEED